MTDFVITRKATRDIAAIWAYIARSSERNADRVEARIIGACGSVAANPGIGHVRPESSSKSVRFCAVPRYRNYVIVYNPVSKPVKILRVLHGAMDVKRALRS